MKLKTKLILIPVTLASVSLLGGCAAIGTAIAHRNLETQSEMSTSIFLPPVAAKDKTIYVQVHNTTDKGSFNIQRQLIGALEAKGYTVYTNEIYLKKAYYLLQVDLLKVGRISVTAAKEMTGSGYGGTIEGAVSGAAIGAVATDSATGAVVGGIAGGVANTVVNNLVQDVTYSGIVDVKVTIQPTQKAYTTRIATSANQVNLSYHHAEPKLEKDLATSISGLF